MKAGPDEVQFGLAHGALKTEQQPVVEVGRVIKPVLVADQRARHGADLQQPVPVGVVAGQPGDLQAEHDPGPAHADLGDQPLKSFPVGGRGAGLALVGVDGDDLPRLGQPSAIAFCRNAYWRAADSVLVSTCRSVDWRTYR